MAVDNFKANGLAALLALCLLAIWELGVRIMDVPGFILPRPSDIAATALIKAPVIWPHALVTFTEILAGIGLALATAIPLAIFMFAIPGLERGLTPFLVASQAIPVFALAPLLVVWLGYGMASKVFMAWVIIFFPITVSLLSGLKSCDPEFRVLFCLMGASFFQKLRMLYWPWALPRFFSGLRVGVTVATIGAVIGEWVGAQQGLGYLMIQANARLQTDLVFAAILWLTAMGLGLWILVGQVEKNVVKWK
ncbi:ABC-type transporter, permease protein [Desulforapulum autotrophicum HRM2]|uniref:ABC-type transporter, permease protein n=1 Tax=Desulforapulum autotrophicum (strain ATCC 43914 / DSM 3382 / VKM B-1955 / HRM2) TaxID=177437 RepID=C0QGS4_DESAH|nr:ABC transporter permease [Desulforapulum autotrophicum]ACN13549.1 ABC-type transporter, permease protein [Desulforapulum autotrophicum HRM2]